MSPKTDKPCLACVHRSICIERDRMPCREYSEDDEARIYGYAMPVWVWKMLERKEERERNYVCGLDDGTGLPLPDKECEEGETAEKGAEQAEEHGKAEHQRSAPV